MGSGSKGPYQGTKGSAPKTEGKEKIPLPKMPNYQSAETPLVKFEKYSLDPTNPNNHGKAKSYKDGLGFDQSNAKQLQQAIHKAVTSGKYRPFDIKKGEFGIKYAYRIPVTGPNGQTKNVIAVYQIDPGKSIPRLVTNYLDKKRKQK